MHAPLLSAEHQPIHLQTFRAAIILFIYNNKIMKFVSCSEFYIAQSNITYPLKHRIMCKYILFTSGVYNWTSCVQIASDLNNRGGRRDTQALYTLLGISFY